VLEMVAMGAVIQILADFTEASGLVVVVEVAQAKLTAVETQIFPDPSPSTGFYVEVKIV
jgi:hypothetical protein